MKKWKCERRAKLNLTKYMNYLQGFQLLLSHLFSLFLYPKTVALWVNYGLTRGKFTHSTKGPHDHMLWGTALNESTVFFLLISGNVVGKIIRKSENNQKTPKVANRHFIWLINIHYIYIYIKPSFSPFSQASTVVLNRVIISCSSPPQSNPFSASKKWMDRGE